MWNGAFTPAFIKMKLDTAWVPEPFSEINLETEDDEEYNEEIMDQRTSQFVDDYAPDFEGTMFVRMPIKTGNRIYAYPCTAGEYMKFAKAGFDSAYLNQHFKIKYVGDWGWPWGRERRAAFIDEIGDFRTV